MKHFLRKAKETWAVNETGEVNDTFMNLTHVIQGDAKVVADVIRFNLEQQPHPFVEKWQHLLDDVQQMAESYEPAYSQMAAVKYFEAKTLHSSLFTIHYANSTAIRLANIYWRGRGERLLSTMPTARPSVWRISMPATMSIVIGA